MIDRDSWADFLTFFFFCSVYGIAAYSCSMELCMDPKSAAARRYISYFMHHINLLRHYKVIPVVVFDGGSMPCKAATDNERQRYGDSSCDDICTEITV